MKPTYRLPLLTIAAMATAAALTGCGKSDDAAAADRENGATTASAPAVEAREDLPVKKLEISGNDQMKFDHEKLEAQARQKIELTFKNVGSMPKESMGHNWCLLHLGTNGQEFVEAGFASASNDYVAEEKESVVIIRTKIIGPGESETLTFTAPSEPGSYEYVCTFPGHFGAGMKGFLEITE